MKKVSERLKAGEGRAEALAATQKSLETIAFQAGGIHMYWAAFQLSGDWRPIDF